MWHCLAFVEYVHEAKSFMHMHYCLYNFVPMSCQSHVCHDENMTNHVFVDEEFVVDEENVQNW